MFKIYLLAVNYKRIAIVGGITIVLLYVLFLSYVLILQRDLFYFYGWLDIPMHWLGGFVIALGVAMVEYFRQGDTHQPKFYYYQIWWALFLGVAWEYYEFFTKSHEPSNSLVIDTIADLVNDGVGAFLAVLLILFINHKTERHIKSK